MFQINKRFFISLFIVVLLSSVSILTKNIKIIFPVMFGATSLYLIFFFVSLQFYKEVVEANNAFNKIHEGKDFVELTKEEARQMRKEGGFEKDGKFMIDGDCDIWKKNQELMKNAQQLQSHLEKN